VDVPAGEAPILCLHSRFRRESTADHRHPRDHL